MNHKCPVQGCPIAVPPKYLMCREHWRRVPPDLQGAVWQAYHRNDLKALREAQRRATDAVNKIAA